MKSQERSDLLAAIAAFCDQQAHWRLGQLIANVAGWADQEIWDVEDEPFLAAANSHHSQAQPLQVVGPVAISAAQVDLLGTVLGGECNKSAHQEQGRKKLVLISRLDGRRL